MTAAPAAEAPRSTRYITLDHWRGVACLSVAAYHSALYALQLPASGGPPTASTRILELFHNGQLGVPIFFVISGYCIAATADRTRTRGLPLGEFFVRRFRRIFPPYWAVIALWALVVVWELDASQWLGNLTLTDGSWLMFAAGVLVFFHLHYCEGRMRWLAPIVLATAIAASIGPLMPRDWGVAFVVAQKALYPAGVQSPTATLLITIPICMLLTVVVGRVFYLLVERHFVRTAASDGPAPALTMAA